MYLQQRRPLDRESLGATDDRPAASEHKERNIEAFDELNALSVASERQIKDTQSVSGKRIGAALEDNHTRLIGLNHFGDYRLKDTLVRRVVDAVVERDVDCVVLPSLGSNVFEITRFRKKVFAELMERHCHHPIGRIEGCRVKCQSKATNVQTNLLRRHRRDVRRYLYRGHASDISRAREWPELCR